MASSVCFGRARLRDGPPLVLLSLALLHASSPRAQDLTGIGGAVLETQTGPEASPQSQEESREGRRLTLRLPLKSSVPEPEVKGETLLRASPGVQSSRAESPELVSRGVFDAHVPHPQLSTSCSSSERS